MARVARMALDVAIAACKFIKPEASIMWQYWKIEVVPPMTTGFFAGPAGQKIENACGKFADTVIGIMVRSVQAIDAAEARAKQAKLDAIKAAEAQAKAKALEEAKQREAEEKKIAAQKKAAADKKAAEAKKEPEVKAEKKAAPPKKEPPKKK